MAFIAWPTPKQAYELANREQADHQQESHDRAVDQGLTDPYFGLPYEMGHGQQCSKVNQGMQATPHLPQSFLSSPCRRYCQRQQTQKSQKTGQSKSFFEGILSDQIKVETVVNPHEVDEMKAGVREGIEPRGRRSIRACLNPKILQAGPQANESIKRTRAVFPVRNWISRIGFAVS